MKANVGSYDAACRFLAGCGLLMAANSGHGWGLAGLVFLVSAFGFCPCYWLLRINTLAWDRPKGDGSGAGRNRANSQTCREFTRTPGRDRERIPRSSAPLEDR